MASADLFNLDRFIQAQAPVLDQVLVELGSGQKQGQWMCFVFPQLRALGQTSVSQFYGIASPEEARAYLGHLRLGPRLVSCAKIVLAMQDRSLHRAFGSQDCLRFRASMTLFARTIGEKGGVFRQVLSRYFNDQEDDRTVLLIEAMTSARASAQRVTFRWIA